jgi:predicted phage terminase large subunit-like protein
MELQWSPYIPIEPSITQSSFLMLPHMEALFGGAAGGGKSVILLAGALQYTHIPGYAALILRRTLTELKQPGALLDMARKWLSNQPGVRYSAEEHTYEFETKWPKGYAASYSPPPAKLQFGYLGEHQAEIRYQGAEYQYVGIDEATHFENDLAYSYLFSRIRKNVCPQHQLKEITDSDGTRVMVPNYKPSCALCQMYESLPLRFRAATNPGGPGHFWIKQRFLIEKEVIKEDDGSSRIKWVGKDPQRPFIPSSLLDNKFLDQQSYRNSLSFLDEVRRQQLEEGDWDVSPDSRFNARWAKFYTSSGDYFQLGTKVYHLDDLQEIFLTVDPAASTKEGMIDTDVNPKAGPSYTVISCWGITIDYQLIWIHMKRFREEIPYVIDQVQDSYRRFKCNYAAVETNGLGIGPFQILQARGLNMVDNRKNRDKIQNAANAILRMKNGRVWLPEQSPWLKTCMNEIFAWTGHPGMPDDVVDTLSDACNILTDKGRGVDPLMVQQVGHHSLPSETPVVKALNPSHIHSLGGNYGGSNFYGY